jgi:hypothetical protein
MKKEALKMFTKYCDALGGNYADSFAFMHSARIGLTGLPVITIDPMGFNIHSRQLRWSLAQVNLVTSTHPSHPQQKRTNALPSARKSTLRSIQFQNQYGVNCEDGSVLLMFPVELFRKSSVTT